MLSQACPCTDDLHPHVSSRGRCTSQEQGQGSAMSTPTDPEQGSETGQDLEDLVGEDAVGEDAVDEGAPSERSDSS